MAFLGIDAQGCDWPCFELHKTDRLTSFFTIAVGSNLIRQSSVNLGNQLTLAIRKLFFFIGGESIPLYAQAGNGQPITPLMRSSPFAEVY